MPFSARWRDAKSDRASHLSSIRLCLKPSRLPDALAVAAPLFLLPVAATLFAATFFVATSNAAEVRANANVYISEALSLTESTSISFGNVASGSGNCTLNPDGKLSTNNRLCTGEATLGSIELSGNRGARVIVNAHSGSAGNITFTPRLVDSSDAITLDGGRVHIPVAGSIDIDQPEPGSYQIPYRITANYE